MPDTPGDENLPTTSPYADYPSDLLETLRRSYRERTPGSWHLANGFNGANESPKTKSFNQVLDGLGAAAMAIIRKVHTRATKFSKLWDNVWTIRESWGGSSEGFFFNSKTSGAMETLLRNSDKFCGDLSPGQSMHQTGEHGQTRQCYREMVKIGTPGLHICIVTSGKQDADGGAHNMHIDGHQLGKAKTKKCSCWYAGLNAHFSDVGDWIIDQFIKTLDAKLTTKARTFGPVSIPSVSLLSTSNKVALKAWLLAKLLAASGDFDTMESTIDTGTPPPDGLFTSISNPLIHEALTEFKGWYMDNL